MQFIGTYEHIISLENLLEAWLEFAVGKRARRDVQEFERNLMDNIMILHGDLFSKTYRHSPYHAFNISDPKPRNIHKATVRDRLLHHAIYRILYPYFDTKFVHDSYSCRNNKGVHCATERFRTFSYKVSKNNTRTAWVLKCDIRKFFASIDHVILEKMLARHIHDQDVLRLLRSVIGSFHSSKFFVGLPLGNLTSQLLVNIYMNEFDQFVKQTLNAKYYVRYADDFVILSHDKTYLELMLSKIRMFLSTTLALELHPHKVSIATVASGVDFLGWVYFPDHQVLRTTTKKRMFRNIMAKGGKEETVQSYFGLVSHGNSWKLRQKIFDKISEARGV